eukprot:CAMPEP_0202870078 /NCGR_PEP_ID=MMETSP1391-20130828/14516_1 /ASSEMBLY_ACC=CAM_ASM_000867 /TAXON_ID=1034604 /ORGANISM="Chlamydomonas leiostraca, Strain SAG 11-49" /LENGTH=101 /DNA_ID=CAMNT_0049550517 /DNA_START=296 /DNA_END=598 /DNA_ORIENTATION=-
MSFFSLLFLWVSVLGPGTALPGAQGAALTINLGSRATKIRTEQQAGPEGMAQHSQQEPADSTVGGPLDVVLEQLQQMNTCDMADALETTDQVSREAVQALA